MITSGGGFSEYYDQPSYQKAAVAGYFAAVKGTTKSPYAGFNASKRAYPDVSLAGAKYRVVIGKTAYGLYGTSASAPAVAGFFSNINAVRLAAGKGSLGYANPALYTNPSAFVNDITSGDNKCGALDSQGYNTCCRQGFSAVSGWDPASGLGSIDYKKLAASEDLTSFTSLLPSLSPSLPPSPSLPSFLPSSLHPAFPVLPRVKSSSSRNTLGTCI